MPMESAAGTSGEAINAGRCIQVLEYFSGETCIFQQDNTKPHTAAVPAAQLHTVGNVRLFVLKMCHQIQNVPLFLKWDICSV